MLTAHTGSMSSPSERVSGSSPGRWLPKITPYRLAFILTTAGLGIAKAVSISEGRTVTSTTIEWVAGVVVALSFQLLGSLEYGTRRPECVDWLYAYDCLNIPKRIFQRLTPGLQHNIYHENGGDKAPEDGFGISPPIVTVYRLLVSTVVTVLGLVKMICAYRGLPGAMNTLEWVITVPLTLCLYCMGLFEDTRDTPPRRFFDVDFSKETRSVLQTGTLGMFSLAGITLCGYWIKYWIWIILLAWDSYRIPLTEDPTRRHPIFARSVKNTVFFLSLSMILSGVLLPLVILWPLLRKTAWRIVPWVRYIAMCLLVLPLYVSCVMLCIHSASMLFTLPNAKEAPEGIFLEFLGEMTFRVIPIHGSIRLLMVFWFGLAIELIRVLFAFKRVYNSFLPST